MLAILLGLFYCFGVRAQNFTYSPLNEYGHFAMKQYKVADATPYNVSSDPTNDPTIDLTMDCLAANGYGQWTTSSNMGNLGNSTTWTFSPDQLSGTWDMSSGTQRGWFLLGNQIAKASKSYDGTSSHPGCQPPGIVSGGKFNAIVPTQSFSGNGCLVAANLHGSVRYVQINSARTGFLIEGLNDERGETPFVSGGTTGDQQIDITLNGLPNPVANRQIIKHPIYTYSTATTNSHPVISSASESDYRDQFAIAIDAEYLYIVWCSINGSGQKEIWATAIHLENGNQVSNPFKVAGCGSTFQNHCSDDFIRPTVSCDFRNDPLVPEFYISFINKTNGTVIVDHFNGDAYLWPQLPESEVLVQSFTDPFSTSGVPDTYTHATHARVLVSSVAGSTSAPKVSVYVLVNPVSAGLDYDLILYKALTWGVSTATVAKYVDGVHNTASYPPPMASTATLNGIKDNYIVAFANPYDNQTGTFNQYHCYDVPHLQDSF